MFSSETHHMRLYCRLELSDYSIQEEQSCLSPGNLFRVCLTSKKSLSRMEKSQSRERLACSGHSGAHQRGAADPPPPFRIAATCHSSKSGVFGSPVQKGLVQAGRDSGALPTGNLAAQMFQMPAAGCFCRGEGQSGAAAGKAGKRTFFPACQGSSPAPTARRSGTDQSGQPKAVWCGGQHLLQFFPKHFPSHTLQVH